MHVLVTVWHDSEVTKQIWLNLFPWLGPTCLRMQLFSILWKYYNIKYGVINVKVNNITSSVWIIIRNEICQTYPKRKDFVKNLSEHLYCLDLKTNNNINYLIGYNKVMKYAKCNIPHLLIRGCERLSTLVVPTKL